MTKRSLKHTIIAFVAGGTFFSLAVPVYASTTYVVQSGDTPCEIAELFRVPCADLLAANGLLSNAFIYPGQVLEVPIPAPAEDATTATTGGVTSAGVKAPPAQAPSVVDTGTADLLAVYGLAQASDPVFAAGAYRRDAGRELVPQARAALRPQLSVSGNYTMGSDDLYDAAGASIAVSQSLFNRANRLAVQQAGYRTQVTDLEYEIAAENLIIRTATAYFSVLATRDNLELSERNQRAIKRQLELAQERLEVGLGTRTDLFDAKARYENAVADGIESTKLLDDARHALVTLVDTDPGTLRQLADSTVLAPPQPDDAEQWVERAVVDNHALKAQALGVRIAGLDINRQRAQRQPTVGLSLSGAYNDRATTDATSATVTLAVNVPFYQGGLINARVREAALERNASEFDYEAALRDTKRNMRQAFLGAKSRLQRINALAAAVRASENALLAKEEGFAAGLTTNIAVLDAQRDLFSAQRDYFKERYDYILQVLELERLAGDLDETDMARVNAWLTAG